MPELKGDDWKGVAEIYKKMTGTIALKPIGRMVESAGGLLPWSQATAILDSGCGPGPVMARILKDHGGQIPGAAALTCADFSAPMLEQARETQAAAVAADANSPWARVQVRQLNAMDLQGVADASQSHVTAGWVYFMTPEPQRCLAESHRVLKPGGVLTCSSWQGSDWMDLMHLPLRVRPSLKMLHMPDEWRSPPAVAAELRKAGFTDVSAEAVPVEMDFDSYEALVDMMMTKMPHVVQVIKELTDDEVARLRELMFAEAKRMAPTVPYVLHGVSIVAVGRK